LKSLAELLPVPSERRTMFFGMAVLLLSFKFIEQRITLHLCKVSAFLPVVCEPLDGNGFSIHARLEAP
jgi:hypothetical protein